MKKNKYLKVVIGILVILIIGLGIFLKLLLFNSSYNVSAVKMSAPLVDKIQKSRKEGSILKINNDELNQIISMYFKEKKNVKGIVIKEIHGEVLDNSVKFYIPSSYKGINILLSSEGSLSYKENKVIYKPSYFKVGKITLPESMVMNKLANYAKKTIMVKDNEIIVDSTTLPIKIKSLEINNKELCIGAEKVADDLETKLKSMESNSALKEQLKNKAAQNESNSSNKNSQASSDPKTSGSAKNTGEMDAALNRISSSLSNAEGSVSTSSQKSVISGIISAANDMKGNPNANPSNYSGSIRAQYNNLSPQEKAEVKAAVFSNIDGSDINIVNNILGK
ncbi:YpmS family protein [Clostridium sp. P21]|uniref:YpmS family protein n=1 Tax=Clostridium muellerianum TaxID=2716538 RepID=A0A7Y0EKE9_9CLOT|nr:hypothetical protein [Clostridium muellerianum]NMM65104.1 YpmS family protein [Clostridium muellerianum]